MYISLFQPPFLIFRAENGVCEKKMDHHIYYIGSSCNMQSTTDIMIGYFYICFLKYIHFITHLKVLNCAGKFNDGDMNNFITYKSLETSSSGSKVPQQDFKILSKFYEYETFNSDKFRIAVQKLVIDLNSDFSWVLSINSIKKSEITEKVLEFKLKILNRFELDQQFLQTNSMSCSENNNFIKRFVIHLGNYYINNFVFFCKRMEKYRK